MVHHQEEDNNNSQFVEILCRNSGKIRRFAKGTDSQFALELINEKLVNPPFASYIQAVKHGEEPIYFGPKSILFDYGNGWKLQTATTTQVVEKRNGDELNRMSSEQFPINGGFEEENSMEPLSSEQFCVDEQDFERENGVELIEDQGGLMNKHALMSSSEKFSDTNQQAGPTLPTPEPLSMIQANYGSDGEETRHTDSPNTTDAFTTTAIFEGREEMINWCKMAGRSVGVVIVIERSDRVGSGRRPRVVLTCERGGVHRSRRRKDTDTDTASKKQKKKSETKKCDCPFRLLGCPRDEVGWEVKVICGTHNHSLGESDISHSYGTKLAPDEEELVIKLTKSGAKPREILDALKKKNPTNVSTRFTIYNFRSKNKLLMAHKGRQLQSPRGVLDGLK